MKTSRNSMYSIIYKLRKFGGVEILTKERMIVYKYQQDEEKMKDKSIEKLCKEYGFARQAKF